MNRPDLSTANAHVTWDRRWREDDGRADWLVPDADVTAVLPLLARRGARRVLDLGCGVGRHLLLLARSGLEAHGLDNSAGGLEFIREEATKTSLVVDLRLGPMTELPYPNGFFDYVLAFNVIYHGEPEVVRQAIAEITRVLRPNGLYQGTMLSKRNARFGIGRRIAPDTWVDDADEEKAHAHFYCDARELLGLFGGFEPLLLVDKEHKEAGSWHWHLLAELAAR